MYSPYYPDPSAAPYAYYDPRAPPYQPRTPIYPTATPPGFVDDDSYVDPHFVAPRQSPYAPNPGPLPPSPRYIPPSYASGYEADLPHFNGGFVRRPSHEHPAYAEARMREEAALQMEMERMAIDDARMRHEERRWRDEQMRRAQWAAEEDRRGREAMWHAQRESQGRARTRSRPPSPDSDLDYNGRSKSNYRDRARSRSKARARSKSRPRESPTQFYAQPHPSPNAQQSWMGSSPSQPSPRQFPNQAPPPSSQYSPPRRARSSSRRRSSPDSRSTRGGGGGGPYPPPPPPPKPIPKFMLTPTPEMEAAATKIQASFRVHRSLKQIAAISSQFGAMSAEFEYPPEVDFQPPSSSAVITLRPAASSSRPQAKTKPRNPAQAKLAFTPGNRVIHAHLEELSRLLVKLDGIESFGVKAVRERRKEAVRATEGACGELEAWWRGVWANGEEVGGGGKR